MPTSTAVQYTINGLINEPYADSFKICVEFGIVKPVQVLGLVGVRPDNAYCYTDEMYCIPAFWHNSQDERNGMNSFLFDFVAPIAGGQNFIAQELIAGVWTDIGYFDNNTGVLYDFGAFPSYPNRSGVLIDWFVFSTFFGKTSGKFRLFVKDDPLGSTGAYSPCFCLSEFTCNLDHFVRIECENRSVTSNHFYKGGVNEEPRTFDTQLIENITLTNGRTANGWYDSSFYRGALGRHQTNQKTVNEITYFNNYNNRQYFVNVENYEFQVERELEDRLRRLKYYGLPVGSVIGHDFNKINSDTRFYRNLPIVYEGTDSITYNETSQLIPMHKFTVKNRTDFEYINKR